MGSNILKSDSTISYGGIGEKYNKEDNNLGKVKAAFLLCFGTFLEYFDFYLYVHMSHLLSELFFPKTSFFATQIKASFSIGIAFIFRPVGALIFGYIGDTIGRKYTVMLTMFCMAIASFIMACLPTYGSAMGGVYSSVAMILCRIVQSISSMGELMGGTIYMSELAKPPISYVLVGFLKVTTELGAFFALFVSSIVLTLFPENGWRLAFAFGTLIAVIGASARTMLREAPEFFNARKRILDSVKKSADSNQQKAPFKLSLACFLFNATSPVAHTFSLVYCVGILKKDFGYSTVQVMRNNMIPNISAIVVVAFLSLICLTNINPMRILKIRFTFFSIFVLFIPFLLYYVPSPYVVCFIQIVVNCFSPRGHPAEPIFIKMIPILQRFRVYALAYALARASMYSLPIMSMTILSAYIGHWAVIPIFGVILIPYAWAMFYIDKNFDYEQHKAKSFVESY